MKQLFKKYNWCLALTTILHMLVDCSTVYIVYKFLTSTGEGNYAITFLIYTAYNFLAFVLQVPIGLILDKVKNSYKYIGAIGCLLVVLAFFFTNIWIVALLLIGLGNALYHCGGAALIFSNKKDKAYPCGVFVSMGTMGLFLAAYLNGLPDMYTDIVCRILACLMLIGVWFLLLTAPFHKYLAVKEKNHINILYDTKYFKYILILVGLLLIVVISRSYIGFEINLPWKSNGLQFALLVSLSITAGKFIGGFLLDKFGYKYLAPITLLVAAVCFLFPDNIIISLLGLIAFNITMPITLFLLINLYPKLKCTMFGILTAMLFIGYLIYTIASIQITLVLSIISVTNAIMFIVYTIITKKINSKYPQLLN